MNQNLTKSHRSQLPDLGLYTLLPSYLVFSVIGFAFWFFIGRHFGEDANLKTPFYYALGAILYGTGSPEFFHLNPVVLWFFPCLIVSQIIVQTLFKAKEILGLSLSLVFCVIGLSFDRSITLPFELDTALVDQFFVYLGVFARKKNFMNFFDQKSAIGVSLLFLIVGSAAAFLNAGVDMRISKYSNPLYFFLSSVFLSTAFAVLFQKLPASTIVSQISKNTIIVFPLHPIVFSVFSAIYVFIFHFDLSIRENPFVGFFASIIITLVLAYSSPIARKLIPWAYGIKPKINPDIYVNLNLHPLKSISGLIIKDISLNLNFSMTIADYLPIFIQVLIAAVIACTVLIGSHIFGQRAKGNYMKDQAYECGMLAEGKSQPQFSVKFYVIAMLFILFDIEVVFMIPWVMIYREFLAANIPILMPMLFFLLLLTLGLFYEMKKGALEWEK